jgi:uncharacterized protein YciI
MLFHFYCTDKPNSTALRLATRPDHLKYIDAHRAKFVIGGPALAEDGQTMLGSVFIMEHADRTAAEAYAAADPYAKAGLFESVVIRPFKKVLP